MKTLSGSSWECFKTLTGLSLSSLSEQLRMCPCKKGKLEGRKEGRNWERDREESQNFITPTLFLWSVEEVMETQGWSRTVPSPPYLVRVGEAKSRGERGRVHVHKVASF